MTDWRDTLREEVREPLPEQDWKGFSGIVELLIILFIIPIRTINFRQRSIQTEGFQIPEN